MKAILLMGGRGERFGSTIPKPFHRLSGKKIYLHTLDRFVASGLFQEIILVCPDEWLKSVIEDVRAYTYVKVVSGGRTRQESSLCGLSACGEETEYVVIHDAVRPFVSQEILRANVEAVKRFGAVDTCISSTDTIVHCADRQMITSIPHRSEYLRGQTPQSFAYPLILDAHRHTSHTNASDDCRLVVERGHPIAMVPGNERNIKITTELDLFLAEQLWRQEQLTLSPKTCSLEGKRFAITGGTGGIGSALSHLLKNEGATTLIISRHASEYPADLTDYAQVKKIFHQLGPLDGLINSIGSFIRKPVQEHTPQDIEALIKTNFTSVVYACQCAQVKEGGHIINIASSAYSRGRKNYALYSATKAATVNFTQGLAEERPDIHINALIPERTNTPMRCTHFPEENPTELMSPEKVAGEIITLLKQKQLTGLTIDVRMSR